MFAKAAVENEAARKCKDSVFNGIYARWKSLGATAGISLMGEIHK